MRKWTIPAAILLGVTACSTGKTRVASVTPQCDGPYDVTVSNNGVTDVEVFERRAGLSFFLGEVRAGSTEHFQSDTRDVYASHRIAKPIGASMDRDLRVKVACGSG